MGTSMAYTGEIRMFGGDFAPLGWLFCDGRLLPISEFEMLFQLLGTAFGGDGNDTFGLPNLNGRAPLHIGPNDAWASTGGEPFVTLVDSTTPVHKHQVLATGDVATSSIPSSMVPGSITAAGTQSAYGTVKPYAPLHPSMVSTTGNGIGHENRQPYLCVSFIICLDGIFPSP
jgi:microcystin-dependent protein